VRWKRYTSCFSQFSHNLTSTEFHYSIPRNAAITCWSNYALSHVAPWLSKPQPPSLLFSGSDRRASGLRSRSGHLSRSSSSTSHAHSLSPLRWDSMTSSTACGVYDFRLLPSYFATLSAAATCINSFATQVGVCRCSPRRPALKHGIYARRQSRTCSAHGSGSHRGVA